VEGGDVRRRRRPRPIRAERGFTLLELLMTLGVTTIGLVGLLSLHLSLVRGNDGASRAAEATQIGHATLESLRSAHHRDMLELLTGDPLAERPIDVSWCRRANDVIETTTIGRNGMTYRCRVIVIALTAVSAGLSRIRVEIGWTDDGATPGAQGGLLDHLIAVEVIRTVEESL
jgi:prepilin-type N-terminal cleavage/methylation domain-containing protein